MQFEEFDKKIKAAADHHYPAYDENAWKKMKVLLDKHLPQREENRRRILFFLLFLGLLGGGGWLLIEKPWKGSVKSQQPFVNSKNTPINSEQPGTGIRQSPISNGQSITNNVTVETTPLPGNERTISNTNFIFQKSNPRRLVAEEMVNKEEIIMEDKASTVKEVTATIPPNDIIKPGNEEVLIEKSIVDKDKKAETSKVLEQPAENKETPAESAIINNQKQPPAGKSEFMISLSAGPDISAVGTRLGRTKFLLGAGIGYTFNNRVTIRSGFYTARKIYSADEDQYHPDQPLNYPYLDHIDADCKVYEIPLTISYQFNKKGKNNWFAGAGVSSLLMKKESYDYVYKYPNGTTYIHNTSVQNKNNHYFSILTLSGGYTRGLGPATAISVEPYLKIPMTGVGEGNVRLNSGGVMISFQVKPFNKKTGLPK